MAADSYCIRTMKGLTPLRDVKYFYHRSSSNQAFSVWGPYVGPRTGAVSKHLNYIRVYRPVHCD